MHEPDPLVDKSLLELEPFCTAFAVFEAAGEERHGSRRKERDTPTIERKEFEKPDAVRMFCCSVF